MSHSHKTPKNSQSQQQFTESSYKNASKVSVQIKRQDTSRSKGKNGRHDLNLIPPSTAIIQNTGQVEDTPYGEAGRPVSLTINSTKSKKQNTALGSYAL